jgi:hypothetical protein
VQARRYLAGLHPVCSNIYVWTSCWLSHRYSKTLGCASRAEGAATPAPPVSATKGRYPMMPVAPTFAAGSSQP